MPAVTTLIAGFGNVLLSDDGFGVEVIRQLEAGALPAHVATLDAGIGGMHFVLRLLEGFRKIVIVDALRGAQPPGTLYIFPLAEVMPQGHGAERLDPHLAEPLSALHLAQALGWLPEAVTIVGCEPASCELGLGLTAVVQAAVRQAVATIRELVREDDDGV